MTEQKRGAYLEAVNAADDRLERAIGVLRVEEDAGRISQVEAAIERAELLERHLLECQRLRREHLGGDLPDGLAGCELTLRRALKDAVRYRQGRPGGRGQIGLYKITARRLLGVEL